MNVSVQSIVGENAVRSTQIVQISDVGEQQHKNWSSCLSAHCSACV